MSFRLLHAVIFLVALSYAMGQFRRDCPDGCPADCAIIKVPDWRRLCMRCQCDPNNTQTPWDPPVDPTVCKRGCYRVLVYLNVKTYFLLNFHGTRFSHDTLQKCQYRCQKCVTILMNRPLLSFEKRLPSK
ncbi:hypothetical protein C7M84_012251 [Penaeus vannamei]|uniref:Uncharacterized protein n=1 Tax=Penaeus vannamei TaxID=6689 RepID=A0A3R7QJK3_PENVA|nr:hypothetical protein C7M84_012251 [Penaeus vannamei]